DMIITEIMVRYAVPEGDGVVHFATRDEAAQRAARAGVTEILERYRATYADSAYGIIEFSPLYETREEADAWIERRRRGVAWQTSSSNCHFCGLPIRGGNCEECG